MYSKSSTNKVQSLPNVTFDTFLWYPHSLNLTGPWSLPLASLKDLINHKL